jgi:hypothetical protein
MRPCKFQIRSVRDERLEVATDPAPAPVAMLPIRRHGHLALVHSST